MVDRKAVNELQHRIKVGKSVAEELLVLSGGDVELAAIASKESQGLDQCKAHIIDRRFKAIEEEL